MASILDGVELPDDEEAVKDNVIRDGFSSHAILCGDGTRVGGSDGIYDDQQWKCTPDCIPMTRTRIFYDIQHRHPQPPRQSQRHRQALTTQT